MYLRFNLAAINHLSCHSAPQVYQALLQQDVLVLDDFELEKLDTVSRLILLKILEDRHGLASTIITSQLPVAAWHDVIGDPTISDAICDRMIHNCLRIELDGPSARKIYRN